VHDGDATTVAAAAAFSSVRLSTGMPNCPKRQSSRQSTHLRH